MACVHDKATKENQQGERKKRTKPNAREKNDAWHYLSLPWIHTYILCCRFPLSPLCTPTSSEAPPTHPPKSPAQHTVHVQIALERVQAAEHRPQDGRQSDVDKGEV